MLAIYRCEMLDVFREIQDLRATIQTLNCARCPCGGIHGLQVPGAIREVKYRCSLVEA
jgi:hypothetical protein